MATNPFIRRLAAILRETADRRAQEWRHEVSEAGWVALPELAAPCSCCHRRALTPISLLTSDGEAAILSAPTVTASAPRWSGVASGCAG
jgi:hypothetical protein